MAEDVLKIVESFEPVHNQFIENLESLKLYKMQLAGLFEGNWADFMDVLRNIIVRLNKRTDRLA